MIWKKIVVLALMLTALAPSLARSEPQAKPATSSPNRQMAPSNTAGGGYYIEFRVAEIGAYGHSYVAYGRLNAKGYPTETRYADLHPRGNYAVMALGHIVPVPASTEWDSDVLKLPVAASYRRRLNATEYGNLLMAVRRARANKQPYWNAITNNCNHFVAQLAEAVGMRAPSDLQVSYAFLPALRAMNEGDQKPVVRQR